MTGGFEFDSLLSEEARHRAAPGLMVSSSGAPKNVVADLLVGQPAIEALPLSAIAETAQTYLPKNPEALLYGRRQGSVEIVDTVRKKLRIFEGLSVDRDQIIITNGSGQAIDLVLRTFANRDQVIVLDEASFGALFVKRVSERGIHVRWDSEGPRPDELDALFSTERPAIFYTIPTFQNPMGSTISTRRRHEILEICHRHHVPILEDDAYYELHYDGDLPPSLFELDGGTGLVIRAGTFSKILGAGIRLGWIAASAPLADRILPLKPDGGTSPFASSIAAEFMNKRMEEQIQHLRTLYRKRRDVMLDALESHVTEHATWIRPNGGFFVWLQLHRPELVGDVVERCQRMGVMVRNGSVFRIDSNDLGGIRLAFSHAPQDAIQAGIKILGTALMDSETGKPYDHSL
jgi:2-aminoadipate transaminase